MENTEIIPTWKLIVLPVCAFVLLWMIFTGLGYLGLEGEESYIDLMFYSGQWLPFIFIYSWPPLFLLSDMLKHNKKAKRAKNMVDDYAQRRFIIDCNIDEQIEKWEKQQNTNTEQYYPHN